MTVITIRHVPDDVRDKLATRAKAAGQSMQQYLLSELTRQTQEPTMAELLERHRRTVPPLTLTADEIVAAVHAGREEREQAILDALDLGRAADRRHSA